MNSDKSSQIVVGIGGNLLPKDIVELIKVGANEFFVGYVPSTWSDIYGFATSPNRRYWKVSSFTNFKDLQVAIDVIHQHQCKVSLAINELSYSSKAIKLTLDIAEEAIRAGIDAVIVADPDILFNVHKMFPKIAIHASGEMGLYNKCAVKQAASWGVNRIVLPRHLCISEIEILSGVSKQLTLETEAFVMSERCCFEGAFCFPTHGYLEKNFCNDLVGLVPFQDSNEITDLCLLKKIKSHLEDYNDWRSHEATSIEWLGGECGLCAVKNLKAAGISYFKIVGRGIKKDTLVKRIQAVKATIRDAESNNNIAFCQNLIGDSQTCQVGYRCYYRD
ncbi:MAG: U32 family peptidase [Phycisphaerae bacterium]|nr:U32 family peptidase [Phycisphaerae bacterium]